MAKKYLDDNGLLYFWQKITNKFVAKETGKGLSSNDFTTEEKTKLSGIEAGAEVNTIETVKVNGSALTPDANRAVDITVAGTAANISYTNTTSGLTADDVQEAIDELADEKVDKVNGKGLSTEDYTTADKTKLAGIETGAQVNVIENIKVNNTLVPVGQKTASITVPTKTSDLTNDSGFINGISSSDVTTALGFTPYDATNPDGYQTATQVNTAIDNKIGSTYKAKGSVTFANLPAASSSTEGFVYNVTDSFTTTADFVEGAGNTYPAGTNVVIINTTGSTYKYDVLSGFVDLSGYVLSADLIAITNAEIDIIVGS
jgi:Cu/Ag efflux protein CusF